MVKNIVFVINDFFRLIYLLIQLIFAFGRTSNIVKRERSLPLYILGNGPSLSKIREKIKVRSDVALCTLNYSIETALFNDLRPDIHLFADGAFFSFDKPRIKKIYEKISNEIDWPFTLIVPGSMYNEVCKHINNKNVQVLYFPKFKWEPKTECLRGLKFYFYKTNRIIVPVQNICIACIFCGINLGYKKIELYGVEHSWSRQLVVSKENVLCMIDEHFYNKDAKLTPFYSTDEDSPILKVHEAFYAFSLMFEGYMKLREYADYLGDVKILNMTEGSFIDAFERGC